MAATGMRVSHNHQKPKAENANKGFKAAKLGETLPLSLSTINDADLLSLVHSVAGPQANGPEPPPTWDSQPARIDEQPARRCAVPLRNETSPGYWGSCGSYPVSPCNGTIRDWSRWSRALPKDHVETAEAGEGDAFSVADMGDVYRQQMQRYPRASQPPSSSLEVQTSDDAHVGTTSTASQHHVLPSTILIILAWSPAESEAGTARGPT